MEWHIPCSLEKPILVVVAKRLMFNERLTTKRMLLCLTSKGFAQWPPTLHSRYTTGPRVVLFVRSVLRVKF
jgi:hypothetical protein